MKKVNVRLQLAQKRAGRKALKRSIIFSTKIALAAIISGILVFSLGSAQEIGMLALLLEGLALFIPFWIMNTVHSARKNPELVSKELEEIARGYEILLQLYEKSLEQNVALLQYVPPEGLAEACVKKDLQIGKDTVIQEAEKIVADTRKILADATPQDQLKKQGLFLKIQQKLREDVILVENAKNAIRDEKFQKEVVAEVLRADSVARKETYGPIVATLQSKIAQSKQVIAEVRQLIAEL